MITGACRRLKPTGQPFRGGIIVSAGDETDTGHFRCTVGQLQAVVGSMITWGVKQLSDAGNVYFECNFDRAAARADSSYGPNPAVDQRTGIYPVVISVQLGIYNTRYIVDPAGVPVQTYNGVFGSPGSYGLPPPPLYTETVRAHLLRSLVWAAGPEIAAVEQEIFDLFNEQDQFGNTVRTYTTVQFRVPAPVPGAGYNVINRVECILRWEGRPIRMQDPTYPPGFVPKAAKPVKGAQVKAHAPVRQPGLQQPDPGPNPLCMSPGPWGANTQAAANEAAVFRLLPKIMFAPPAKPYKAGKALKGIKGTSFNMLSPKTPPAKPAHLKYYYSLQDYREIEEDHDWNRMLALARMRPNQLIGWAPRRTDQIYGAFLAYQPFPGQKPAGLPAKPQKAARAAKAAKAAKPAPAKPQKAAKAGKRGKRGKAAKAAKPVAKPAAPAPVKVPAAKPAPAKPPKVAKAAKAAKPAPAVPPAGVPALPAGQYTRTSQNRVFRWSKGVLQGISGRPDRMTGSIDLVPGRAVRVVTSGRQWMLNIPADLAGLTDADLWAAIWRHHTR